MRKSIVLIIASILICTVPAVAVAKSGAALLSTCIANYDRCFRACYDPTVPCPQIITQDTVSRAVMLIMQLASIELLTLPSEAARCCSRDALFIAGKHHERFVDECSIPKAAWRDVGFGSLADIRERTRGCPLYPQKQTCSSSASTSAKCHIADVTLDGPNSWHAADKPAGPSL